MAGRGAPRKAPGATADKRNGKRPAATPEPDVAPPPSSGADVVTTPTPPPPPPKGLLPDVRAEWLEFWASPVSAALELSDRAVLRRLFLLRDEYERTWRDVRRMVTSKIPAKLDREGMVVDEGQDIVHTGRLALGSQGQLVLSGDSRFLLQLAGEIRQLEDRLAVSLRARTGLTIAFGNNHPARPATPTQAGARTDLDHVIDDLG